MCGIINIALRLLQKDKKIDRNIKRAQNLSVSAYQCPFIALDWDASVDF